MAALGASTTITSRGRGLQEQVVVSGDTIYSGALVGLGKASNTGYLVPWRASGPPAPLASTMPSSAMGPRLAPLTLRGCGSWD